MGGSARKDSCSVQLGRLASTAARTLQCIVEATKSASEEAAAGHGEDRAPPSPPRKLSLVGHVHLHLVVSTPGAAEAILRMHDHVFASRRLRPLWRVLAAAEEARHHARRREEEAGFGGGEDRG